MRLRGAGAQEGRNQLFSPLLRITPLPSGRAARVKVSDAFRLPPNCYCGRQGIGCHPRGVRLHSTRTEHRLHANSNRKPYIASTPASRVRRKNETAATLSQIKFFHRMWIKFVCGRGHPRTSPGGGDVQEGAKRPLLCAVWPRRPQFQPVKSAGGTCPRCQAPCLRRIAANTQLSNMYMLYSRQRHKRMAKGPPSRQPLRRGAANALSPRGRHGLQLRRPMWYTMTS